MKNFLYITTLVKTVLLLFLLTLVFAGEVFSFQSATANTAPSTSFVPLEASRLWIQGSSNVNEFECNATNYTGEATLPAYNDPSQLLNLDSELLFVKVDIEVDSIDCGKRKMNSDLREALQAKSYPDITFVFDDANLLSVPQSIDDGFEVEVQGYLTVAGTTKKISFQTDAYFLDDRRVRAVGESTIKMTDYGVKPPTALMGLIRADEELTVHFDLVATARR